MPICTTAGSETPGKGKPTCALENEDLSSEEQRLKRCNSKITLHQNSTVQISFMCLQNTHSKQVTELVYYQDNNPAGL